MKYIKISQWDTANGPGIRIVLWVSGCDHYCEECQNPSTWDPDEGIEFSDDTIIEIVNLLSKSFRSGLTLSGGDPLYIDNRDSITKLVKTVKEKIPSKSIWCYTGYLYEDVENLELMNYIDVLVDGEFHKDEKDLTLPYCGSKNQRVIDVQKSRKNKSIILYEG